MTTIKDAAALFGVSKTAIRKWLRDIDPALIQTTEGRQATIILTDEALDRLRELHLDTGKQPETTANQFPETANQKPQTTENLPETNREQPKTEPETILETANHEPKTDCKPETTEENQTKPNITSFLASQIEQKDAEIERLHSIIDQLNDQLRRTQDGLNALIALQAQQQKTLPAPDKFPERKRWQFWKK